ncbi:phosphoenolpyruvate synthase [Piscirickettsia salmonis]|uniref:phosphoenolpyruvate synthase n=1 Tax=Piscirickettsia salmonis TaxID=1238 RepID=UPI0007D88439|nr:Phosphoenolpyruvate synthase [Piscirickettsiaceae bacterium NZ-RLO1]
MMQCNFVVPLSKVNREDVAHVGGKNASLGEMLQHLTGLGVEVPSGVATTAAAFQYFLAENNLAEKISEALMGLNVDDVDELTRVGKQIRELILAAPFPVALEQEILSSLKVFIDNEAMPVAVRSSATAEDLPTASFAGQQETFLNVRGYQEILAKTKEVYASLYNDRAIAYRVHQGFAHEEVSISVGIQRMVESEVSGVMFTLDTETGFDDVVLINGAYGLGESVVQGSVSPDEFYVYKKNIQEGRPAVLRRTLGSKALQLTYKDGGGIIESEVELAKSQVFCLTDQEAEELARFALCIEKHYGCPMDIEWGKDQNDGRLYILQARPETVQSQAQVIERYQLKEQGAVLSSGRSVGKKIASGRVRLLKGLQDMKNFQAGDILVTDMTDPDWEPIMKRAAAIVTNRGGRTCHAAIIARELGVPAVVGCGDATAELVEGQIVTVSCAEGDTGYIYEGALGFDVQEINCEAMPKIPVKIMMNVAHPERAFALSRLPHEGVGLARLEFVIGRTIGIHPQALLEYDQQPEHVKAEIDERTAAYASPVDFYVEKIVESIATLAAAFAPKRVIVRLSDFKSNEYANLLGGDVYEPHEENPMIGFRGASRYVSDSFKPCFELECRALLKVREEYGFKNVDVMVPFVRTLAEGQQVVDLLSEYGINKSDDMNLHMMCELPSNVILIDEFLDIFDGVSIGSNDLTQLTLGLDRDSGIVAHLFDERNLAVKRLLEQVISRCKARDRYVGICGQGPSDYPELAAWLLEQGISSLSLNADTVLSTWLALAKEQPQASLATHIT